MSDKKNSMVSSAMTYAIPLGLFWIFKYFFVILGDYSDLSRYIVQILTIGTPVVYYILLCHYRDKERDGRIDYGDIILFSMLLFLFASFLEIVIASLHVFIINPAVLGEFSQQIDASAKMFTPTTDIEKANLDNVVNYYTSNIGAFFILSKILGNFILGLILSLILGYFVSKKTPDQSQKM